MHSSAPILIAIASVVALALRVARLGHGMPPLLEEAEIYRLALGMWNPAGGLGDLDSHQMVYPGLTIYLQLAIQWFVLHTQFASQTADFLLSQLVSPQATVIPGRWLGVIADLASLLMVGVLTRRYGAWASACALAAVAFSAPLIRTARLLYSDPVLTALALGTLLRLHALRSRGRALDAVVAGVLLGLAVSAKYSALALALPAIACLAALPTASARSRLGGLMGAGAMAAFFATTPFSIVAGGEWLHAARFVLGHLQGTLGTTHAMGAGPLGQAMWTSFGVFGVVGGLGIALAAARNESDADERLTLLALVGFAVPIALFKVDAERYLLPVIALGAVACAGGVHALARRTRPEWRAFVGAIALGGALLACVPAGIAAARQGRRSTEIVAAAWCDRHVAPDEVILSEMYGPSCLTPQQKQSVMRSDVFRLAAEDWRARYAALPARFLSRLPLTVTGSFTQGGRSPQPTLAGGRPLDWNQGVYDPRLLRGVDWFARSAAVGPRLESEAGLALASTRLYRLVDSLADSSVTFVSDANTDGPAIVISRLGPRFSSALDSLGALGMDWWSRPLRERSEGRAAIAFESESRWVYDAQLADFVRDLGANLLATRKYEPACDLLSAHCEVLPDDEWARAALTFAARKTGRFDLLERAIRHAIAATGGEQGRSDPLLIVSLADALAAQGFADSAMRVLEPFAGGRDPAVSAAVRRVGARMAARP